MTSCFYKQFGIVIFFPVGQKGGSVKARGVGAGRMNQTRMTDSVLYAFT